MNVSDLFKAPGKARAKAEYKEDYTRGNVYAKNFTKVSNRNVSNEFTEIVSDEDIKEIKLVGEYNASAFPKEANNRVQFFYTPDGKKIDYKEITKVEQIQASEYATDATNQLKKIGFNEFYQLYKLNEVYIESKLCIMAVYRG